MHPFEQKFAAVAERIKQSAASSPKASMTAINLFQHPDSHPLVLDLALLQRYGPEWMTWEAEVLEWRIPKDFKTSDVSDLNMHKLQAVKTLHFVDTFWERWEVFVWCTMAFNDIFPDFEMMQVPTVAQALVGVDIANRVRDDISWSEEVKDYLAVVFKYEGIFCPLPPIDFISIDTPPVVDCAEIQKLWPSVRSTNNPPTANTITAEQLRRMLIVNTYLEENRAQLDTQLKVLAHV